MNRERAKELLPIIQAYAEGKTIQCIGVGFENWHDVDNELEIDSMRYKYRIKPESKYNEIFKLKKMLEKSFVPFEWKEFDKPSKQGFQILYPNDKNRVCSVIEHSFSYGNEKDLLEIQGLLTADEEECDSVLGNLTATDVFQRILSHWEKINRIKPEEDAEITSIEELKEAIFSKKEEIQSKGLDGSLFLYITISKNMMKALEERYSCVFRTDKGSVNTLLGIPFVAGDKTKVEIRDRFVELLKKEHTVYRPFKSCNELIDFYKRENNIVNNEDVMPIIWLKNKDNTISLITDYKQIISPDEGLLCSWVTVDGDNYNMQKLFENYTFLDGSPCGVSNGKTDSNS